MNRIVASGIASLLALSVAGCGGEAGREAEEADTAAMPAAEEGMAPGGAAAAALETPSWMQVDQGARTVTLEITAGADQTNNRWNFNGYANGNATIVVPEGYKVTINFKNADQANPHSLAIDTRTGGSWPATIESPQLAFQGATTSGATSMTEATQPGQSETVEFTADKAGNYSMVCYVPAHAATGMWIRFDVSAEGQAGLRTS